MVVGGGIPVGVWLKLVDWSQVCVARGRGRDGRTGGAGGGRLVGLLVIGSVLRMLVVVGV